MAVGRNSHVAAVSWSWAWLLLLSSALADSASVTGLVRLPSFRGTVTCPCHIRLQPLRSHRPQLLLMHCDDSLLLSSGKFKCRNFSVLAAGVTMLVPLVKMVALEPALRECKGVQGKKGEEEVAVTAGHLQHLSPALMWCCLFNFLRLDAIQGLFALQVQNRSFVLLCVDWKTMEILSSEWGGRPEFGISSGPSTGEVFFHWVVVR